MKGIRSNSLVLQIIVTEHDVHGRPIGEQALPPMKVFRAGTPDVWKAVDAHVAQVVKAATAQQKTETAAPTKAKGKAKKT